MTLPFKPRTFSNGYTETLEDRVISLSRAVDTYMLNIRNSIRTFPLKKLVENITQAEICLKQLRELSE